MIRLTLTFILLAIGVLNAQDISVLQFPPYIKPGSAGPAIGELLTDTLWNTGKTPVRFYLQFNGKIAGSSPLKNDLLKNDAAHTKWLKTQSNSTDPNERRLQYVLAEARLQKAFHTRGPLIADPEHVNDIKAGFSLLQSTTGSALSIQYKQGKMYSSQVLANVTALAATDSACKAENFRMVSLPNLHLIEVMYKGKWVAVDPNSGTFALIFKNKSGGYYSTEELLKDTSLIYPNYIPVDVNGQAVYALFAGDTSRYRLLFDNREVITTPYEAIATAPVSGDFILPPGAGIVFTYKNGLSIDTSTASGKQYFKRLFSLQKRCTPATTQYCDSFLNLIATNEGVSLTEAKDAVYEGKITFYNGPRNFSPFRFEAAYGFPFAPTVQLLIPPHEKPLVVGRDIKAPLLALGPGFSLWNDKIIPSVAKETISYIDNGEMPPSAKPQALNAAINLNTVNWLGGLTICQYGNMNSLVITRRNARPKSVLKQLSAESVSTIFPAPVKNK
jgi:hypothetical protein